MNEATAPARSLNGWGPVPIGEVLQAALALKRREFRQGPVRRAATPAPASTSWQTEPGEAPILVVGCSGSAGTSTVALLIAQSFARSRLVECAPGLGRVRRHYPRTGGGGDGGDDSAGGRVGR